MKKQIKKAVLFLLALVSVLAAATALPAVRAADPVPVTDEAALRAAIDEISSSGSIKLETDVALSEILVIPEKKTVTLDLNGKALSRGLTQCVDQGGVIRVEPNAKLTVSDSSGDNSGRITGGASWNGGGICNHGTLTVTGGTITGNKALHGEYGGGGGIYSGPYNGSKATLTIKGGVIEGNEARNGGGICSYAKLTVENGVIRGNKALYNGRGDGGGIYTAAGTALTIKGGVIENNETRRGGGVFNNGTMSLEGGVIGANTAQSDGYGDGGGVYNNGDATLTVKGGEIRDNVASEGGGVCNYGTMTLESGYITGNKALTSPYGRGGGIYNGGDFGFLAALTLKGGFIQNNEALVGGGLYSGYSTTSTIETGVGKKKENGKDVKFPTDVTVTQNTAVEGDGIYIAGTVSITGAPVLSGNTDDDDLSLGYGKRFFCGALAIQTPVGVTVNEENAVFTWDYARNNPGIDPKQFFFSRTGEAVVQLTDADYGEVRLKTDSKTVVEVFDHGNLVNVLTYDSPSDAWYDSQRFWTPCWYYFDNPELRSYAEELKNGKYPLYYSGSNHWEAWYSKIDDKARTLLGYSTGNPEALIYSDAEVPYNFSVQQDTFDLDVVAQNKIWEGHLQDDYQVKITLGSDWNMTSSLTVWRFRNVVLDLNGHCLNRGGKKSKDGRICYLEDFAKLTILDSRPKVKGYDGFKGGVITGGNGDDCGGGFILNDYAELNVLGGTIYGCKTDEHGGAVYSNDPHTTIRLKDCTFYGCETVDSGDDCNGGALYVRDAMRVTIENVGFIQCRSEDNGGAVYLCNTPGDVSMKNVIFSSNSAKDYGGALAIGSINDKIHFLFEATDCTFNLNSSGKDGGAVCVSDNDDSPLHYPIVFRNCLFEWNSSDRDGSAFELDDNSVSLIDCTVIKNTAKGLGAIYVNDDRKLSVGGKTIIRDNTGQNVILDDNKDKTWVSSTGLLPGSDIVINAIGSDNTILMKDVDKRQTKYFRTEFGHWTEFRETGTRDATLTLASLFGKGSVVLLVVIAAAALLAGAYFIRKKKKLARAVICVALVLAMLGTELLPKLSIRAEDANLYLEDIKICVCDSAKDAKKYFDSIGYQYLDADLNASTGTGKYVYLGYKPTEDRDKAVTSIRLMPMQSGYQIFDYDELMAYMSAECADAALAMKKASDAFVENYNAGSPKARDAYMGLNMFYLSREDNMLLGDYIVSGRADQAFYTDVLVKASAGAAQSISGLLNIGLAPYENAYDEETGEAITVPWASLISTNSLWAKYREGLTTDERDELNRLYGDQAYYLFHSIQDFTTNYENALARYEFNGGKVESDLDVDNLEEGAEALDEMTPEDTDVLYLAAYELLNSYDFDVNTKLGDWFLSLGRQTSDAVDYFQLYPVLASMGDGLSSIIMVTGFLNAVLGLGENQENEEFQKAVNEMEGDFGVKGVGVIDVFANLDDLFRGKTFAYTSEAIRKNSAENRPITPLEKVAEDQAFINEQFKKIGLVVSIGTVAFGALLAVAKIGLAVTVSALSGATAAATATACAASTTYAFFSSAVFYLSGITSFLGLVSLGILAVSLIVMLCFYLYESHVEENKADYQTEKPDFVYDAVEYNGYSGSALYKCALDNKDKVGDINASKQWKWVTLCFSTDKGAGSPIVADETGQFFKAVWENPNPLNGYDCVRHFGERGPANFNANCSKGAQTYVHYTTEDSLARKVPETTPEPDTSGQETPVPPATDEPAVRAQYIQNVILSIGRDAQEAKDAIIAHENKYYVLDYNLSPGWDHYTYLGYTLTEDSKDAITDLRVAPYAGGPDMRPVMYGDVQYNQIGILGFYVGKGSKQGTPAADALFYTKDKNAGSPITADSLHPIKDFASVEDGWEPVSYFGCDLPYNFDMAYEYQFGSALNYTWCEGRKHLNDMQGVYLYYEPSVTYTSGEKYLSGMFFEGVYDTKKESGSFNYENYIRRIPHCAFASGVNLAASMPKEAVLAPGELNPQLYLCYTWTYNPKRAVSNLAIYQGDTFSTGLPYAVSKTIENVNCNYVAAINWQQQYLMSEGMAMVAEDAKGPLYGDVIRFVSPLNAYMNCSGSILDDLGYSSLASWATTTSLPEGIRFGYGKTQFLPTELYVSGHTQGLQPLTLNDVVLLTDASKVRTSIDGVKVKYELSGKTLAGTDPDAVKSFRQIPEMKNTNSTALFNLSYPDCRDTYQKKDNKTQPLYLFLRGQQETPKKYISSLSVGSFSREQYKAAKPGASDDELKAVDGMVNLQAMVGAVSGCTDELKVYNFALEDQSKAWYNKKSDGVGSGEAPKNSPATYIGVSRTDSTADAIKGVILYKSKADQAPNTIEINNVQYACAGIDAPIYMKGAKYFLYYTKNSGAIPGVPIRDVAMDALPMLDGAATNLCANDGGTELYGNTEQTNYLHVLYDPSSSDFYNKLYIGRGVNEKAAQLDLLAQGCVQYAKIDLNKNAPGNVVLLGYRTGHYNWDTINSKGTDEEKQAELVRQQRDAIYDVVVTKDEPFHPEGVISRGVYYSPVSSVSLNAGCPYGAELYMYFATPFYSSTFNKNNNASTTLPETVFSGYVKRLAFAENERVPYTRLLVSDPAYRKVVEAAAALYGASVDYTPWEYVLELGDAGPVDLNAGAVKCNGDYCEETRLYMFAQRNDGSVKPAGEITGGYVENSYEVGNLYIRK